jgi:hypothetical protein
LALGCEKETTEFAIWHCCAIALKCAGMAEWGKRKASKNHEFNIHDMQLEIEALRNIFLEFSIVSE